MPPEPPLKVVNRKYQLWVNLNVSVILLLSDQSGDQRSADRTTSVFG